MAHIATYIGLFFLLKWAASLAYFAYTNFIRAPKNLKKYGSWAVVTGSTDGIGESYAHELARKGINIVLVSRSEEKLSKVAADIESKHKVQTKTIAFDFSIEDHEQHLKAFKAQLSSLDIGILVNNVGASYEYPEYFLDVPQDKIDQMIRLNIKACTYLTSIVLPGMVERKRGAVINISSASGTFATPYLTVYCATKAYMDFFSRGLAGEYAPRGIFVQSLHPFYVVSKLSKIRRSSLTVPTSNAYARSAVRTIGYDYNTCGYWVHEIMHTFVQMLPETVSRIVVAKQNAAIRQKALGRKTKSS